MCSTTTCTGDIPSLDIPPDLASPYPWHWSREGVRMFLEYKKDEYDLERCHIISLYEGEVSGRDLFELGMEELVRWHGLPPGPAKRVRLLVRDYTNQRIATKMDQDRYLESPMKRLSMRSENTAPMSTTCMFDIDTSHPFVTLGSYSSLVEFYDIATAPFPQYARLSSLQLATTTADEIDSLLLAPLQVLIPCDFTIPQSIQASHPYLASNHPEAPSIDSDMELGGHIAGILADKAVLHGGGFEEVESYHYLWDGMVWQTLSLYTMQTGMGLECGRNVHTHPVAATTPAPSRPDFLC
ncbi:hypothetical protein DFH27DRAFT_81190 [Peziza echinospora]|nr:hypothetical protein DFH27DRAFT_81190 [Peziza echinospora]